MRSGVYAITHLDSTRVYIGSSVNVPRRWSSHRRDLRRGTHPNRYLQAAWTKYGEQAFAFAVVEECPPGLLVQREQAWLDELRPFEQSRGFNLSPSAYSLLGFRFSASQRERVSMALRGKPKTAEHRANLWANRSPNAETFAAMGRRNRGGTKSTEHRARIGAAQQGKRNHGAKLSDESVVEIRRRLAAGEPGRHIARSFGVHESIVSEIKSGRRWTHVESDPTTNP